MRDAIALIDALEHPNVEAFLRVIRAGEGTADEDGYRRHFGGRLFESFADHPRVAITAGLGSKQYTSTAAGAYQFLSKTWDGLVRQHGFADFEPTTQDIAAVALIDGRGALDDVIAGRFADAIRKCAREWASLPGSPYGQPTKTMAQAEQTYRLWGGKMYQPADETIVVAADGSAASPSPTEATMPLPAAPFLWGLASTLIDLFTPLAKEKISREIGRHTDNPEIQQQIATGVIEAAKSLTNKTDDLEAVVAVKADPALVREIEDGTLERMSKMAPLLDKLAEWDAQAWTAEEASRDAAAARLASNQNNQDLFLTRSIVAIMVGLMVGLAVLLGVLAYLNVDTTIIAGMAGLFTTLAGGIAGKFSTRYDHAYGSSRSSGAKDVTISELSRSKAAR